MKKIIYTIIIFIFSLYLIGCSTNDIINDPNIDDKEEVNGFDELYSFNQIINILEEVDVNEYDNTSNIIIVCIFAALFTLIALIAVPSS